MGGQAGEVMTDRELMDMALKIGVEQSGAMMLLLPLVPAMSDLHLREARGALGTVIRGMETRSAVPLGKRLLRAFIHRGSGVEDPEDGVRCGFWWMEAVVSALMCDRLRIVIAEHVLQAVCPDDSGATGAVGGDALLETLLEMMAADDAGHLAAGTTPTRALGMQGRRVWRRGAVLWAGLCVCRSELERRPRSEMSKAIKTAMQHIGEGLLSEEGEVRVEAFRCKLAAATKFGSGLLPRVLGCAMAWPDSQQNPRAGVQGMLGEVDGGTDLVSHQCV